MRTFFTSLLALSSCLLVLAGCQTRPQSLTRLPTEAVHDTTVKVALLLPMSGRYSSLGNALFNSAQLSLFENAPEGIELILEDTGGNPGQAASAAQNAISKGAKIIVGPLFSTSVSAVKSITASRNIPVLTFSNNRQVAGGNVYILGFMPDQQVYRILEVAQQRGLQRIGILYPNNSYGQLIRSHAESTASRLGMTFAFVESYPQGSTDMKTQADLINSRNADAVLLPEGGQQLTLMASSLVYNGVEPSKTRFLGTGVWDSPEIYRSSTFTGSWFAAAPLSKREEFMTRYQQNYGSNPPRLATLAYDAISMISLLTRTDLTPGSFPYDRLTQSGGFQGVDGVFRLNTDGTVERGLAVYEVSPTRGLFVISSAPWGL